MPQSYTCAHGPSPSVGWQKSGFWGVPMVSRAYDPKADSLSKSPRSPSRGGGVEVQLRARMTKLSA